MGYRIKEMRFRRRMSQDDLAKASHVSRTTISGLESGRKTDVKTSTLLSICRALGTTVDELFFDESV